MSVVLEAHEPSARYREAVQPALVRQFELLATAPGALARLRRLIRTLAVEGKLVAQVPGDEPASTLLARVKAHKARLASAGDIRAVKPFADVGADEQPFGLPRSWAWARFGDITINRDGERVPVSSIDRERRAKVYDYYGASGVIDKIDGYLFDKTLLLIGEDGANLLNRSTPIAFLAHGKYWVNNHAHVIDTIEPGLMQYLELFINAISLEPYVTGTAQPKMNQAKLNNIVVALPPLPEQARIVARVDELMRLCDALEAKGRLEAEQHARLLGTLLGTLTNSSTPEELAANWQRVADHFDLLLDRPEAVDALEQTILQLAVRGLLVQQDAAEEPASGLLKRIRTLRQQLCAEGKIKQRELQPTTGATSSFPSPPGWETVHLGTLIELISGQHLGPSEYQEGAGAGIPYLTGPAEFGEFSPVPTRSTAERRAVARCGDILITVKGSGVGKLNVVTQPEIAISRQLMAIRPLCTNDKFLFLVLWAMGEKFQSQSVGIAIPGIGREDVAGAVIGLPPLAEQTRIVARVEELRRLCADLRDRLAASQTTQSHLAEALVAEVA